MYIHEYVHVWNKALNETAGKLFQEYRCTYDVHMVPQLHFPKNDTKFNFLHDGINITNTGYSTWSSQECYTCPEPLHFVSVPIARPSRDAYSSSTSS